jgi:hypothetical protein
MTGTHSVLAGRRVQVRVGDTATTIAGAQSDLSPPGNRANWFALTSAGSGVENGERPCHNQSMTKAELHELVDRLPDGAVDGAAVLLGEISAGRIDPEQAWFWTQEWQAKEREADDDLAAGRIASYESDEEFLAVLDERTKPLDADA